MESKFGAEIDPRLAHSKDKNENPSLNILLDKFMFMNDLEAPGNGTDMVR